MTVLFRMLYFTNLFRREIVEGETAFTAEDGYQYCTKCVCYNCTTPLNERTYLTHEVDGEMKDFCYMCLCHKCESIVPEDSVKDAKGYAYCDNCTCTGCSKPLWRIAFHTYEEGKFCDGCVCSRCDAPLGDEFVTKSGNGRKYCNDCTCSHCKNPLSPKSHLVDSEGNSSCEKVIYYI